MKIILNNKKINLNINSDPIDINYLLKKIKKKNNINNIIAYKVNEKIFDLKSIISIKKNDEIVLICKDDEMAKDIYNHSTAHLLAHSIHRLYPKADFAIGPSIENGFYYDIDFKDHVLSENDFAKIENEMHKIANEKIEIKKK